MKKQKERNQEPKGLTFFCEKCKTIGKVLVELWTEKSEGPYKLQLVQHKDYVAIIVDEIRINEKSNGEDIHFHYCGDCGNLLGGPYETESVLREVGPNLNNSPTIIIN